MPTVILLDNSLSMCQYVKKAGDGERLTKRDVSYRIVHKLVEKLSTSNPYEKLALVGQHF